MLRRVLVCATAFCALTLSACAHHSPPSSAYAFGAFESSPNVQTDGDRSATANNLTFWTGITSASDQASPALDMAGYRYACFYATLANTSTPVGNFEIQHSIDGVSFKAIYLDANRVQGANFTNASAYPGGTTIAVSSPAGAVSVFACVEKTMRFVRLFWDNTSGGAVGAINAFSYVSN